MERILFRAKETNSDNVLIHRIGTKTETLLSYGDIKTPIDLMSCTKSFTGLLFGIIHDRYGLDIQDPVHNHLDHKTAERYGWTAAPKNKITIYHLLTQSSGLDILQPPKKCDSKTMMAAALGLKQTGKLGAFNYGNMPTMILSEIIKYITGQDMISFARDYLFTPMGITNYKWNAYNPAAYGLTMSAADLVKIGVLVYGKGLFAGKRIVSASWIKLMLEPSKANKNYGLLWWLDRVNKDNNITWAAKGWGGQYLVINPRNGIVAVRQFDVKRKVGYDKFLEKESVLEKLDIKINGHDLEWYYNFKDFCEMVGGL